jgi:hypothetical protein
LGVDEAIDALVADHPATSLARKPTGDLFRRPTSGQTLKHGATQGGLAFEAGAHPAPRSRLLLSITRLVMNLFAAVARYLTRDR